MNMSYCKFENTLRDLRDCYENWGLESDASDYEKRAKKQMTALILEMAEEINAGSMEEDKTDEDEDDEDLDSVEIK